MNLNWRGIRLIWQPRVRRAIGVAYLLGLVLSIVVAWAIAAFGEPAGVVASISATEADKLLTIQFSRSPVSLAVEVARQVGLNWSPRQATRAPNTSKMGDITTAWASLSQDGQDEWLELDYARSVLAQRIVIHETFNPGAVSKVTSLDLSGTEIVLWAGADPAKQVASGIWIAEIPLQNGTPIVRLRLYIDSRRVPGWNEIDAVGLLNAAGDIQWAMDARASSTYATNGARSTATFEDLRRMVPYWVDLDPEPPGMTAIEYEAYGWPFLSLYGQSPASPASRAVIRPWIPIWPGLFANGALYGVLLILLYAMTFGLRRFLRQSLWLRRGCCMECGYDLRFDLARGCPECGWRRGAPELSAQKLFDLARQNMDDD